MATTKNSRVWDEMESGATNSSPKLTSVSAHTQTIIVVSMSVLEMERLIETFGVADVNLENPDRQLQREFADAVRALR